MRDPIDDVEPVRPLDVEAHVVVLADEGGVEGGDKFPDVAKDEKPNDAKRDSSQTKFLLLFTSYVNCYNMTTKFQKARSFYNLNLYILER